jgi:anti-anti-sigma factor
MTIATEELPGGVTKVILEGRLDIEGAAAVDLRMNVIAGISRLVLLDLQNVSYLGSMGLRTLVIPAHTVQKRGGRVVFFRPNELVEKVLKVSQIDDYFPIHHDLQSALGVLQRTDAQQTS